MNPNEINKAIAEYCGTTNSVRYEDGGGPGASHYYDNPNYHSDLNAMHEAEKVLSDDASFVYDRHLTETPGSGFTWGSTAAQRAEAFLRTIGKWKD